MADRVPSARVTVVTVGLNAARDLPLTLESAIAQDVDDLQIVVVDGGSWDESGAVLRRYADQVDTIVSREDAGVYHAMNDALTYATGKYVIFMNAGDRFFRADAVSRMLASLEGDPDVFYGDHVYVDGRLELIKRAAPFEVIAGRLAAGTIDDGWHGSIPGHQATFVRADLLHRLRFDTRLMIGADHDLLFRAWASGARMQYVDEVVAHYAAGGMSVTIADRCRIENASIYRRFTSAPEAVDRLFYPGGAPFLPVNAHTGIKLDGFDPADGVDAAGCILLSPDGDSVAIALGGDNAFERQRAEAWVGDRPIGSVDIPIGTFRVELAFDDPVPPYTLVTLRPERFERIADLPATAFVLRDCRFQAPGQGTTALAPGRSLSFEEGAPGEMASLLGLGWSGPEPNHVWSIGPQSELWVKAAEDVCTVRLTVSGNPHVEGRRQQLAVSVNGVEVTGVPLPATVDTILAIDCTVPPWRTGQVNRILLTPDVTASCATDSRDMGLALRRIEAA